jgi:hypothetical protein
MRNINLLLSLCIAAMFVELPAISAESLDRKESANTVADGKSNGSNSNDDLKIQIGELKKEIADLKKQKSPKVHKRGFLDKFATGFAAVGATRCLFGNSGGYYPPNVYVNNSQPSYIPQFNQAEQFQNTYNQIRPINTNSLVFPVGQNAWSVSTHSW